jgi:hypothetical protein
MPYLKTQGTSSSAASSSGTQGTIFPLDTALTEVFNGEFTCAALVTMGVGSSEMVAGSTHNVMSVNNTRASILYYHDFLGSPRIVRAYDGETLSGVISGSWDRKEIHLKVVETNTNGTQFRVGNKRYTEDMVAIDSNMVWSAWTTYDGSFNPETYLKLAYGSTVPLWFKQIQVWSEGERPEADIVELAEAYS